MADDLHSYESWGSEAARFQDGSLCIGIDLGTTNSCVGMWMVDRQYVKMLKNHSDRGRTTPSVVHFHADSDATQVGHAAIAQELAPVGNTIRVVKRLMGQTFDSKAVEIARRFSTCSIVRSPQDQAAAIEIERHHSKQLITPEHVSSCILADLKRSAETYTNGKRIDNVVVTVPAYFNDSQRKATIRSAEMAGFKAIRLLNEPTAAAMAYGLFLSGSKRVVVVDFGGGTLDVSLLQIDDGKFQVLAIGGDTTLGGEDINHVLLEHVLDVLHSRHGVKRAEVPRGDMVRLQRIVEAAKIALSTETETTLEIDLASVPSSTNKSFSIILTRRKLELLCESIWKRCLGILSNVLRDGEIEPQDVDEVVMVGGSTRIPYLRERISAFFDHKELCLSVNADEVVCEGAAIQAAILSGMDHRVFTDVLMMDVIPLSIGLETADGRMEVLLRKNSRIPVEMTKLFETYEDGQRGLTVEVYEGEHEVAKENDHICYFNFPIPRAKIGKAGEFAHPVTFKMNASGVLQVTAGAYHDSEDAPMSTTGLVVMLLYLVALAALYVFARFYFVAERDLTSS